MKFNHSAPILKLAMLAATAAGILQEECHVSRTELDKKGASEKLLRYWRSDLFTHPRYKTECGRTPPTMETWRSRQPCDDGYLFVAPRAAAEGASEGEEAEMEGPAIFSTTGDLVWTQSGWGRTSDLKVQQVGNRSYITFWHDDESHHVGGGSFVMLDQSYEMVKELRPAGKLTTRPLELKLTDKETAIMLMHNTTYTSTPFGGLDGGWIIDAIIQEINVTSNSLISEWRASEHFDVNKSLAEVGDQGKTPETAFDFFRATGIDFDNDDNYVISSRNMFNAAAVRPGDGSTIWVLGGPLNTWDDVSAGQAVAMIASQGVQWHGNSTLMLLDGGYVPNYEGRVGRLSNARMLHLNVRTKTAVLLRTFTTPVAVASQHSQGSVRLLPSGNVFIGWGDDDASAAAYTEYSPEGRPICAARFQTPLGSGKRAAEKSRRSAGTGGRVVSKYDWVGKPLTKPVMVVKPEENAVYVSWNGDTQVHSWLLRTNYTERRDGSMGVRSVVPRTGFETSVPIPEDVGEAMQLLAVDNSGRQLVQSEVLWKPGDGPWSMEYQPPPPPMETESSEENVATDAAMGALQRYLSSERNCQLLLAISGLGLAFLALLWCRWTGRRWWKTMLLEGSSWYQRQRELKGEKGIV